MEMKCKVFMESLRAAAFVQKPVIFSISSIYFCLHAYSRKALYVSPKTLPERTPRLHNRC